jgi:predicted metal-binding protein
MIAMAISIVIHVVLHAFISIAVAVMMAFVPGRCRQGEECSTQRCGKSNGDFPHDLSPSSSSIG